MGAAARVRSWEPVAATDHGVDRVGLAELAPQRDDRHRDRAGEWVGVLIPDPIEQVLGGDHDPGGGCAQPDQADRRRSIITPTAEGRRRLAATRDRRRAETGLLLDGWTSDDLETLAEMFTRYNEAVARRYLKAAG